MNRKAIVAVIQKRWPGTSEQDCMIKLNRMPALKRNEILDEVKNHVGNNTDESGDTSQ